VKRYEFVCDRCGEAWKSAPIGSGQRPVGWEIVVRQQFPSQLKLYTDLCPECRRAHEIFLKGEAS
jgi:hypothetical protein